VRRVAIRSEELGFRRQATVYRFPTAAVRARAAREARRRLVRSIALALVVVVALMLLLTGGSGTGRAEASHRGRSRVTVGAGDTLWDIAVRYAPADVDPRAYVDALIEANSLSGPLQAGARLRLP
jgi:Tfp pilus assembly protein FimV